MPTIDEILNEGLGLGTTTTTEKTASVAQAQDEIEKLALEVGLADETPAASPTEVGQTKEAHMSLVALYGQLFPEDAAVSGAAQEKTATVTKEAADVEEAEGKVAHDAYAVHFDSHLTKMAEQAIPMLKKLATETVPQAMENNEVTAPGGIKTTPHVTDLVKDTNPKGAVGKFEQEKGPMGAQEGGQKHAEDMSLAVQKHLLKLQLS